MGIEGFIDSHVIGREYYSVQEAAQPANREDIKVAEIAIPGVRAGTVHAICNRAKFQAVPQKSKKVKFSLPGSKVKELKKEVLQKLSGNCMWATRLLADGPGGRTLPILEDRLWEGISRLVEEGELSKQQLECLKNLIDSVDDLLGKLDVSLHVQNNTEGFDAFWNYVKIGADGENDYELPGTLEQALDFIQTYEYRLRDLYDQVRPPEITQFPKAASLAASLNNHPGYVDSETGYIVQKTARGLVAQSKKDWNSSARTGVYVGADGTFHFDGDAAALQTLRNFEASL